MRDYLVSAQESFRWLFVDALTEGWQEDGLSSLIFVVVAFPPSCISSKTLSGARIFIILNIISEDHKYASFSYIDSTKIQVTTRKKKVDCMLVMMHEIWSMSL